MKNLEQQIFDMWTSHVHAISTPENRKAYATDKSVSWETKGWMQNLGSSMINDLESIQSFHGGLEDNHYTFGSDIKREVHVITIKKMRDHIGENLDLALLSPSAYVRDWAEWIANEKS